MNRVREHNRYRFGVCITLGNHQPTQSNLGWVSMAYVCHAGSAAPSVNVRIDVGVLAGFDEPVGRVELRDELRRERQIVAARNGEHYVVGLIEPVAPFVDECLGERPTEVRESTGIFGQPQTERIHEPWAVGSRRTETVAHDEQNRIIGNGT